MNYYLNLKIMSKGRTVNPKGDTTTSNFSFSGSFTDEN